MQTPPTDPGGIAAASAPSVDVNASAPRGPSLQFVPARVLHALLLAIGMLALAHTAAHLAHAQFGGLDRTLRLFELDEEANLPTWFSSITLFTAAMISAGIALVDRERCPRDTRSWLILAAGFVYLSIDELAMLHDKFGGTLARGLGVNAQGWITYVWVVPALLGVAVVGVLLLGFIRRLPSRIRRLSVLAAICYIGGAVGCEMVSARLVAESGESALRSLPYRIEVLVEETLEMTGVALWIYTQLLYFTQHRRLAPAAAGATTATRQSRTRPLLKWRSLLPGRRQVVAAGTASQG